MVETRDTPTHGLDVDGREEVLEDGRHEFELLVLAAKPGQDQLPACVFELAFKMTLLNKRRDEKKRVPRAPLRTLVRLRGADGPCGGRRSRASSARL